MDEIFQALKEISEKVDGLKVSHDQLTEKFV
jgi:hypothetical protein